MKPNKHQLAYLIKMEKWAKNNINESKNFIKEFDEVFKDNLNPFSTQDWIKDTLIIDVDFVFSELKGRIEDAKSEVN